MHRFLLWVLEMKGFEMLKVKDDGINLFGGFNDEDDEEEQQAVPSSFISEVFVIGLLIK